MPSLTSGRWKIATTMYTMTLLFACCLLLAGPPYHDGSALAFGCHKPQGAGRTEKRTLLGKNTMSNSAPPVFMALQTVLLGTGARDVSSCMASLDQLLSPPPSSNTRSPSLCVLANALLASARGFATECIAAGNRSELNERVNGSTVYATSDGTPLANWKHTVDLLSTSVNRCCSERTPPSTPSLQTACLLQDKFDGNTFTLHGLLMGLKKMAEVDETDLNLTQTCAQMTSSLDYQFRQVQSFVQFSLAMASASSHLTSILRSVQKLEALTATLSIGQSSANLTKSPDIPLVICSTLFPVCEKSERIPPCPKICKKTELLLGSFRLFLDIQTIPILNILNKAMDAACFAPASRRLCLQDQGAAYIIVNSSHSSGVAASVENRTQTGGFCLNTDCKSPLRSTSDPRHWDKDIQKSLSSIHTAIKAIFPHSTLPLNRSILPCGRDCISIGFTDGEHRSAQALMTLFSTISVVSVIFTFVICYYNRKTIGRQFIRRAAVMFLVCSGTAQLPYMFSAKGANRDSILCHSDGTLITHPGSSNFWCWWTAMQAHLFATIGIGYITVLTFSWQELARALSNPRAAERRSMSTLSMATWWTNYQRDIVSLVLVVIAPLVMAIAVAAQRGYEAIPIFGVCSLSVERDFIGYYTWYHVAGLIPNMFFLLRGVRTLVRKHGVLGFVHWIGSEGTLPRRSPSINSGKLSMNSVNVPSSTRGLKRFSKQMLLYLLLSMVSFVFNISYSIYVQANVDDWNTEVKLHIECAITSCSPDTCPPLPKLSAALFVSPLVVSFTCVFVLTTWAYSSSFLAKVPWIGRFIRRERSTSNGRGPKRILSKTNNSSTPPAVTYNSSGSSHITL